jgi:hypothetical protein
MNELALGQEYIPKSVNPDNHPQSGLSNIIPDFSFKSIFEYYSMMRFIGYIASGTASTIGRAIDEKYFPEEKVKGNLFTKGRKMVGVAEACLFLGNIVYNIFRDRKNFMENMAPSVAAELGKDPDHVDFWDLSKSKNPIVKSMMSRFFWQNTVRTISSMGFFHSIEAGVVLNAADITFERAIAVEHTAYEILSKTVKKVHDYNLGQFQRGDVRKQLMESVQRSLIDDHQLHPLSRENIETNQPVFERLTDLVIDKKFDVPEVIYTLGRVIDNPNATHQILQDIETIEKIGLKEFCNPKNQSGRKGPGYLRDILSRGKDVVQNKQELSMGY